MLGCPKQSSSIVISENTVEENVPEQRRVKLSFLNSAALGFLSYSHIFMDILTRVCEASLVRKDLKGNELVTH